MKPNIIYILADDMGYGDVSALNPNCPFETKNLDNLCNNGITFKDAHATSAVCTPSRYSILTGRYNWCSNLKNGVLGGYDRALIEEDRITIAHMLKDNGYKTCAVGKWHLGMNFKTDNTFEIAENFAECKGIDYNGKIEKSPNYYGFDYFYGISGSLDMPPYIYIENDHFTKLPTKYTEGTGKGFWRYGPTAEDFIHSEILPHLTNKVIEKIEEYKDETFFIYFPLPAPHSPILPSNEFLGKSNTNEYGDFVLMCDAMVGKIVDKLKQSNIEDNTIIIFTADNGCSLIVDFNELKSYGHNPSYIFRGHKADIYEGGHRIPLIIQWKDKIKANTKSNSIVCLSDFFATIADYLNWEIPNNTAEDSVEFKLFEDNTKKLHNASFCKNRLCPMCNWRRSKKIFGQVAKIVDELDKTNNYDYIFLTLTLKNCNGNELGDNIDLISKSFKNMFRSNKKVKKICKGYFRGIEVTCNKNDNTYHPHIHCIIVVNKGYFSWRNEDYIKTEEWSSIWQYYLKVDYTPIVDVRKVKSKSYNNNGIIEISKYSGVAEISKYTVKSKDIIITRSNGDVNEELTDNNICILHFALKGKRLVTFGGIMKELHKKLNLEDMNSDNVDLIRTDVEDDNNILNYIILKYKWSVGISNYKLFK